MAPTKLILVIVVVTILPFVRNAPSNIVKTGSTEQDLRTRLVFIDEDADDAVKSNSQTPADVPSPIGSTRSRSFAKSMQTQTDPPLEVKTVKQTSRITMDDERQIWGIAVDKTKIIEDESYYSRPISLPKNIVKIPKPVINHVVSDVLKVTSDPKPSACDMSIVICCCESASNLKQCFSAQGCPNATEDMFPNLCSKDSIDKVIKNLAKYYKGNQEK